MRSIVVNYNGEQKKTQRKQSKLISSPVEGVMSIKSEGYGLLLRETEVEDYQVL